MELSDRRASPYFDPDKVIRELLRGLQLNTQVKASVLAAVINKIGKPGNLVGVSCRSIKQEKTSQGHPSSTATESQKHSPPLDALGFSDPTMTGDSNNTGRIELVAMQYALLHASLVHFDFCSPVF